jgi:hypothetical protein
MKGLDLLESHPASTEIIRAWFMGRMIESLQDENVPDEFKNFMREQGIQNDKLATMIDVNPRMLLDVFDENDIFISINITDRKFTYRIDNVINPTEYSTRKECELISITRAFEILENKLTPKELIDETDNE